MKEQIEKQAIEEIDELTTVLYEANHKKSVLDYHWLATEAYNAGYRKQSEGEWETKHHMSRSPRGRYTSYNTYTCDVCGKANGRRKTPFCPHCGAKMKGGA